MQRFRRVQVEVARRVLSRLWGVPIRAVSDLEGVWLIWMLSGRD